MGAMSCCCDEPCVDATTLPTTLDAGAGAYAVSFVPSQWYNVLSAGVALPCCWETGTDFGSSPLVSTSYNGYETQCSTPYGFSGPAEKILASIRWKVRASYALTKQTCKCDAQPTAVSQYVLTARETYAIRSRVFSYFGSGFTPCSSLAYDLANRISPEYEQITQTIVRRTYFTSAITASYLLTDASLASCDDTCPVELFTENTTTITATVSGVSRSITWDDTSDWNIDLTY